VLYLDHLSNLYYIMSDVKHHANANTSILGRQYTGGNIIWVVFVQKFEQKLEMSQNGKLLILTTKINDKTV